jgi:signal transduction histidine kinase
LRGLLSAIFGVATAFANAAPPDAAWSCQAAWLTDPEDALPAASVTSGGRDHEFRPLESLQINLRHVAGSNWIRLDCRSHDDAAHDLVVRLSYAPLDVVDVHEPGDPSPRLKLGDRSPFSGRILQDRLPAFPLTAAAGVPTVRYIRLANDGWTQVAFMIMTRAVYERSHQSEAIWMGLYYGIAATVLLLNLFLVVWLRERVYLNYLLYVFSISAMQFGMNGYGFFFLWTDSFWLQNVLPGLFSGVTRGFAASFIRDYLDTRRTAPVWDKLVASMGYMGYVLGLALMFGFKGIVAAALAYTALLTTVIFLGAGIARWRGGFRPAKIYTLAWSAFIAGIALTALKDLGVLTLNFLSENGLQIGSAIEFILLMIGLGQRLRYAEALRRSSEDRNRELQHAAAKKEAVLHTTRMLAHDVRAPFSIVQLALSRLDAVGSPEEARRMLTQLRPSLRSALTRVDGMISDVIEIGQPARPAGASEELALEAVIADCLDEVEAQFPTARVELSYDLAHTHALHGHPTRVHRIIANIVQNALEATPKSSRIWFRSVDALTADGAPAVRITIGNSGSFVPEADRERLFEAYHTAGKARGTGLGLAIARKVVTEHGGEIHCESHPVDGTELVFTLAVPGHPSPARPAHSLPEKLPSGRLASPSAGAGA